jgi:hypothetical protein
MKKLLLTPLCILALCFTHVIPASAGTDTGAAIAADVLVVRPVSLAATIIGTAIFVVSLPIAVVSGSTERAAEALVARPARATFTLPLGDFEALKGP